MQTTFTCKQFSVIQEKSALKVGTDAILLGAFTEHSHSAQILDIGTGTGILSLMMAQKFPNASIHAIDVDSDACADASLNFSQSSWAGNMTCFHIDLHEFAIQSSLQYDIIICNPPFFHQSLLSLENKKNIARHSISLSPEILFEHCSKLLSAHGIISVIIPYTDAHRYLEIAHRFLLYPCKEVHISALPNRNANRIILCFSRTFQVPEKISFCIRNENHEYSTEYSNCVKDFLLNF
jgi:tRNA1Val (adenine37-N6)-methyltransferase